jgi:hypothetical protein
MENNKSKQLLYYYNNKEKIQPRQKIYFKKYYEDNKQYFRKRYEATRANNDILNNTTLKNETKEVKPSVIFTTEKIEVSLD